MATPKKSAGKKAAKKAPAKKSPAKKSPAKKSPAKKAAKKSAAKKSAKKSTAKKPTAKSAANKAKGAVEDISVVVTSRVKEVLKNLDMRTDSDLASALNRRVQDMLTSAAERAKQNKRSTVRPHDL